MKKFIMVAVVLLTCFSAGAYFSKGAFEKGNDDGYIKAAREIASCEGVLDAAVIGYENKGMAGIRTEDYCDKEEVLIFAEDVLGTIFGEEYVYYISVGDETAEKIIELSLYLDSDMDKGVLEKRTRFLLEKNNEI